MPALDKLPKIDLSIIKKLVTELETQLILAEELKKQNDVPIYIVEIAKAAGLATGIMQEGGGLIGDIQELIKLTQQANAKSKEIPLSLSEELSKKIKGIN